MLISNTCVVITTTTLDPVPEALWASAARIANYLLALIHKNSSAAAPRLQGQKQSLHLEFSTERKSYFFCGGAFHIYCLFQVLSFPNWQFPPKAHYLFWNPLTDT